MAPHNQNLEGKGPSQGIKKCMAQKCERGPERSQNSEDRTQDETLHQETRARSSQKMLQAHSKYG